MFMGYTQYATIALHNCLLDQNSRISLNENASMYKWK